MMHGPTMAERVLAVLLECSGHGRAHMLETYLVADRIGVPLTGLIHTIPTLYERGWLDLRCPPGTLKLSASGLDAAQAARGPF